MSFAIVADFLVYALGSLSTRGVSFLVLPLIMQRITPAEYGTLGLLMAFFTVATAFFGLGLRQFLSLEYFHHTPHEQKKLIQELLIIYTIIAAPAAIMIWLSRHATISFVFFNAVTSLQLAALLISSFLFFYTELMYQLMQYQRHATRLTTIQFAAALSTTSISLIGVYYFKVGITAMIWAQTISLGFVSLYAAYYFSTMLMPFSLSATFKKSALYLPSAIPFVPTILANWLLSSADRWILASYCSMHEVGIYSSADLATQLFYAVVLTPWAGSYLPHIMQQFQNNKSKLQSVETNNKKIMWLSMIACTALISVGYPIAVYTAQLLLPAAYQKSMYYAWYLLMGQIFLLGSYFCSALIQYHKKTYFLAFSLFIPALLNIMLNFITTPIWGIMGCTISTLISYAIYFMMTYLFNTYLLVTTQKGVLDETSAPASPASRPQSTYQFRK